MQLTEQSPNDPPRMGAKSTTTSNHPSTPASLLSSKQANDSIVVTFLRVVYISVISIPHHPVFPLLGLCHVHPKSKIVHEFERDYIYDNIKIPIHLRYNPLLG